ncbi:restriction endonuclease subunit S [Psychrobacter glacincola]|uniref:restriction endonuclease subunit S n=1 Tax=Psychrobacter glacincola TaxID=56810 RepID=UPI0039B01CC9
MSQSDTLTINPLITDHIDIWTSSILAKSTSGRGSSKKYELYGITKLRELILELAVRGKLVPQDPNDEPASVLLEKIAAEKSQLVKEGKIKKAKPLAYISKDEKLFDLPGGWEWCKLGNIASYGNPFKAESDTVKLTTWILELEDIEKGTSRLLNKIRFSERQFKSTKNVFSENDVLYGKLRPYLDKVIVADESGVCTTEIIPITCHDKLLPHYLRYFLKSPNFIEYANSSTHGMSLPRLGTDKAVNSIIALPPVKEQHRIVAKVDELMQLCDDLEQQTEASIGAHATLVEVLLTTLTDSADANELAQNWARLSENFDSLFTTEQSIEAFKQTALQLAVMGKLVPQDPNDEPASVLLERIDEEKSRLVKEKKIKRAKPLPLIDDDEKPFKLPRGWEWCKLGNLAPQFQNGASSRGDKEGKPITVLRLADIKNWQISLADTRTLPISPSSIDRYLLADSDILIIRVNGSADIVGRFITCKRNYDAIYCDHFIRMRFPIISFSPDYLFLLGSSNLVRDRISDLFISTAGQKTVNQGHLSSLVIPLPPLAEQHRIVAKVDELMQICDQIKDKLQQSQTTQVQLTDALVEQALA